MNINVVNAIARAVVEAIKIDVADRRGLRQEWEQIDEDTQAEILGTWLFLVKRAIEDNA